MTDGLIFDYASCVEVVAREANACLYPFFPSEADLMRTEGRSLRELLRSGRYVVAPTASAFRLASKLEPTQDARHPRVRAFDAIEEKSPHVSVNYRRPLSEFLVLDCYMCGGTMAEVMSDGGPHRNRLVVHACPMCGYWESEHLVYLSVEEGTVAYDSYTHLRRACLREFTIVDETAPLDAIRRHLARNPSDIRSLTPRKLEQLVGSVFSDFLDCEALHVGRTGDGGVDLVLLQGDYPTMVQVKGRQDASRAESVSAIREFLGAILLKSSRLGMFVTTADRFTKPARAAAEQAVELGLVSQLTLVDGKRLIEVLELTRDQLPSPWTLNGPRLDDPTPDYGVLREPFILGP